MCAVRDATHNTCATWTFTCATSDSLVRHMIIHVRHIILFSFLAVRVATHNTCATNYVCDQHICALCAWYQLCAWHNSWNIVINHLILIFIFHPPGLFFVIRPNSRLLILRSLEYFAVYRPNGGISSHGSFLAMLRDDSPYYLARLILILISNTRKLVFSIRY